MWSFQCPVTEARNNGILGYSLGITSFHVTKKPRAAEGDTLGKARWGLGSFGDHGGTGQIVHGFEPLFSVSQVIIPHGGDDCRIIPKNAKGNIGPPPACYPEKRLTDSARAVFAFSGNIADGPNVTCKNAPVGVVSAVFGPFLGQR